MKTKISLTFFL